MQGFLARIVAFPLIVCLLADPSLAAAFSQESLSIGRSDLIQIPSNTVFSEEALEPAAIGATEYSFDHQENAAVQHSVPHEDVFSSQSSEKEMVASSGLLMRHIKRNQIFGVAVTALSYIPMVIIHELGHKLADFLMYKNYLGGTIEWHLFRASYLPANTQVLALSRLANVFHSIGIRPEAIEILGGLAVAAPSMLTLVYLARLLRNGIFNRVFPNPLGGRTKHPFAVIPSGFDRASHLDLIDEAFQFVAIAQGIIIPFLLAAVVSPLVVFGGGITDASCVVMEGTAAEIALLAFILLTPVALTYLLLKRIRADTASRIARLSGMPVNGSIGPTGGAISGREISVKLRIFAGFHWRNLRRLRTFLMSA